MPTIKQLPAAPAVTANDLLPVSQNGLTRSLMVSTLLSSTQPALSLAQGALLGRASAGLGGPEAVSVGTGLSMQTGAVVATGEDHTTFPQATGLLASDEVVLNSGLTPKRLPATKLRALFSAGAGVQIDDSGVISATSGGSGTASQGPKGDTGPQGPAGQGFAFRGAWQPGTNYSSYDVVTSGGQAYIATTSSLSGTTFSPANWTLMAAQGAAGPAGAQGAAGPAGAQGAAGPTTPATSAAIGAVKPGSGLSVAIDGMLSLNNVSLPALAQGGATIGQLLGWTGTTWGPTTPATGTTYTASAPITITAGVVGLSQGGAVAGQVLTWNGTAWVPQTPTSAGSLVGSATPVMDGAAAAGVSTNAAREDHRHPIDISRAPLASPVFTGSLTLPTWTTSTRPGTPAAGMEGFAADTGRRETYTALGWVQYVRLGDIPAASGQLLGGSGTAGTANAVNIGAGLSLSAGTLSATYSYALPVATVSALGGVKQGAGVTIAADGTISATGTSGVSTFNTRAGAVTLALADITGVTGTGAGARASLGLATVASSGAYADLTGTPSVPTASATIPAANGTAAVGIGTTFARADHVHPTDTSREGVANKGQPNGYAGLDGSGKVPTAQLPAAVVGALNYQGTWNANTNSPALASGAGTKGFYYTVATAGAAALDGIGQWNVGDHAAFNGTVWEKLDGLASEVVSVAGRTGAVALAVGDVSGAAPLASPALTGTPTVPTAAADTNTTQAASTAFVLGQAAAATPLVNGTAAVGTSTRFARADHVHPTDTTRLGASAIPAASGQLLGGSGTAGAASAITVGTGLSLSGGTLSATGGGGGTSAFGTPQVITASGTQAIDTTKSLVVLNNTSTVISATLANGTVDGQEIEIVMLPSTAQHTIAGTIFEASQTLAVSSPNAGVSLCLKYSTNRTSWYPRNYDGGYKAADYNAASAVGSGDLFLISQGGVDKSATAAQVATFVGSTSTVPVTTVSASGTSQALAFASSGSKAYDVTLTGNCAFAISGGTAGQLQTITLVIRGGAGGFTPTLPSGIKWPGGVAPAVNTSAGSYNEFYIRTIDGGTTYSGNY